MSPRSESGLLQLAGGYRSELGSEDVDSDVDSHADSDADSDTSDTFCVSLWSEVALLEDFEEVCRPVRPRRRV